jgi:F0F1-type ATP synthase assembly protein I
MRSEAGTGSTLTLVARKKSWPVLVGEYTSLAFMLPIATFIGYAVGYALDKAFDTHWIYIPGLLLGIAAGFVQLVRQLMRDTRDDG